MKKRIILNILAVLMLICALAPVALADESVLDRQIAKGTCQNDFHMNFLLISCSFPWRACR